MGLLDLKRCYRIYRWGDHVTSLKLVAYNASSGFQSAQFPTKSGCFNSEVTSLSIQGQLLHLSRFPSTMHFALFESQTLISQISSAKRVSVWNIFTTNKFFNLVWGPGRSSAAFEMALTLLFKDVIILERDPKCLDGTSKGVNSLRQTQGEGNTNADEI